MILNVNLKTQSYDVIVQEGALDDIANLLDLDRKVLVVTDDGVPKRYAQKVASSAKESVVAVLKSGEESKNFDNFKALLSLMLTHSFTRKDCVVAVGGGVVGDIAGFASSCYMRGIDFYNVPTTLLSQIDSSVGGKTAIDFEGVKNVVGTFYQPGRVVIDTRVLATLADRQLASGLAEAIKMSLTSDKELFELIENCADLEDVKRNLPKIIERSLRVKIAVVEQDEKEGGLRRVLNFGHTVGHAIESAEKGTLLHGECVGLGMLPMCSAPVRERLEKVLEKCGLPHKITWNSDDLREYISHDKKTNEDGVCVVKADEVGSFRFENATIEQILKTTEEVK